MNTLDRYDNATKRLRDNPDDLAALHELISIYPGAWREYDHEIMDSIALYVSDLGGMDTIVVLEAEIAKADNPGVAKELQDWIANLQRKAASSGNTE